MVTYPETMNDGKVNRDFVIRVHSIEVRVGLFIIHPVGSINTNTSPILQKELQRIIESRPEIVLLDMNQVNYINFRGLRVILKTIMELNQCNGKFCLMNLQPQVKEMFEIMHRILPKWVFEGRKQLEHYLDPDQNDCTGNSQWTTSDDADNVHNLDLFKESGKSTCCGIGDNG
ncbi:MAG: STAS domain-containing protein [Desulfobacterales bacterium]